MAHLSLMPNELLLIIGCKEAQIYEQSKQIDKLNYDFDISKSELYKTLQQRDEARKDNDMAQFELKDLRSRLARAIMVAEKV